MTKPFCKTDELKRSIFVQILLRTSPILCIEKHDEYCSIWSILVQLHNFENCHFIRVSYYRQNVAGLNLRGLDFWKGVKCRDVHIFKKLRNFSTNIIEVTFYWVGSQ